VSAVADVQRDIRRTRACRVIVVLLAAFSALALAAFTLAGFLAAPILSALVIGCLMVAVKQTRLIGTMKRRERELSRPRMTAEDYRHLREMETELGWEPSEVPGSLAAGGIVALEPKPRPVGSVWSTGGSGRCTCPACQQSMREARGKVPDDVAAQHFAQLARVGREHCTGFCPICQDFDRNAREAAAGAVQARLPAAIREATVATMEPGRPYWTVPWAMLADEDGRLWLRPGYTAWDRPGGTARMRMELREDGYHVWPVPGETYTPEALGSQQFMPVAVLEGER
jgi:hypothetical protein